MSNLESWMSPEIWSNTYQPLPLRPSEHKDFELHIKHIAVGSNEIADFKEKGFWISPKIIDDETIKLLNDETKRVFEGEVDFACGPYEYPLWFNAVKNHKQNEKQERKINNAWYVNSVYRRLASNAAIGAVASQLLETDEIRLWHDQAIWKPQQEEIKNKITNDWHQNFGYWQISNTSNMMTVWIPLQDVNLENGGIKTIVGSHKWGLVKDSTSFTDDDLGKLKERFSSLANGQFTDENCIIKAGQIVFLHSLTFQSYSPNRSGSSHLSVALHLMPKGAGYVPGHGNHPILKDLGPNARSGMLFEGDNFPLLYRKRRPSSNFDYP